MGALEKCEQSISNILSVDVKERWTVAGGKIETIPEAKTAQLGDKQRRKWFKRSLDKRFCVFFLVAVELVEFFFKWFGSSSYFFLLDWCVLKKVTFSGLSG